jgi:hypothetical protein
MNPTKDICRFAMATNHPSSSPLVAVALAPFVA